MFVIPAVWNSRQQYHSLFPLCQMLKTEWVRGQMVCISCSSGGRCLPSYPSPSLAGARFSNRFRERLRNSVPFSENRTNTRSADLGNPLGSVQSPAPTVQFHTSRNCSNVFTNLIYSTAGLVNQSVLRGLRGNDRLQSAKYYWLGDLISVKFAVFCALLLLLVRSCRVFCWFFLE